MRCPHCQAELQPGDRFCNKCGRPAPPAASEAEAQAVQSPHGERPARGRELLRLEGHQEAVMRAAFSPDGRRAVSASRDGEIVVWDLAAGTSLHRVRPETSLYAVEFSPDRRRALCVNRDLSLVDVESGQALARFDGGLALVMGLAFLPDGRTAAYGHIDNSVRLLDLEAGRELRRLEGHGSQAESLVCTPDGRQLVSGRSTAYGDDEDGVLVWDLTSAAPPRRTERRMGLVSALAVSADSRRALAGTYDCNVYLWDLRTGREARRYEGHVGNIFSVAFSPDGRFVVSASGTDAYDADMIRELGADNTVRVWDAESPVELARLEGHSGGVNSVAVSPDGRRLLSGSADRTVRLWAAPWTLGQP